MTKLGWDMEEQVGQVVPQSWAFWNANPGSSQGCQGWGWTLEPGGVKIVMQQPLPTHSSPHPCHSMPVITFGMGARHCGTSGSDELERWLTPISLLALSSQNLLSTLLSMDLGALLLAPREKGMWGWDSLIWG